VGKSFDEYKAEHLREPFPLPMPDGKSIPVPLPTLDQEKAMARASAEAAEAGEWTPFSGLEVVVGDGDAAQIAEAWGDLPSEAWDDVMADMRKHFGRGNSKASPSS
jgi:hypothetical protein